MYVCVWLVLLACVSSPVSGIPQSAAETPLAVAEAPLAVAETPLAATPSAFAPDVPVRLDAFVAALANLADAAQAGPAVRDDFSALAAERGLPTDEKTYRDYVRVKLAFQATREGGWWDLHWGITNREPQSDAVWAAWATWPDPPGGVVAECDELSALFSFMARKLGVANTGLFWPTWNHTVSAWKVVSPTGEIRVVVPTSQVFLAPGEGLGTRGFDPAGKRIYNYGRADVPDTFLLPSERANTFVERVRIGLPLPEATLAREQQARIAGR